MTVWELGSSTALLAPPVMEMAKAHTLPSITMTALPDKIA